LAVLVNQSWTVRESNPGKGVGIFRKRPDRPCDLPSLLCNGFPVIPLGKEAEAWR